MSNKAKFKALAQDIRIQDIVAKTARVNLRDSVRVLRALAMVLHVMDDRKAEASLNSWLYNSATFGGFPGPLHSKPDAVAIDACDDFYHLLEDEYGEDLLKALFDLSNDPYYESKVAAPNTEGSL